MKRSDDYENKWQNIELYFQILNSSYPLDANEDPYCKVHTITIFAPIQRCTRDIRAQLYREFLPVRTFGIHIKEEADLLRKDMPLK